MTPIFAAFVIITMIAVGAEVLRSGAAFSDLDHAAGTAVLRVT